MRLFFTLVLALFHTINVSKCANILGIWPIIGSSHYTLGNRLMKSLAEAGHDVTLISPFEDKIPPANGSYRNIVLNSARERLQGMTNTSFFELQDVDSALSPLVVHELTKDLIEEILVDDNVQRLLRSNEKFDVLIIEQFGSDVLKAIAHHFNAHLIVFSSVVNTEWVNDFVGNPSPVAYLSQMCTSFPTKMSLFQRAHNSMIYVLRRLINYLYIVPHQERTKAKYFPNAPSILDINSNTSLVLINGHESFSQPKPLVANMIQIGGYHLEPPKKLPNDLQNIMDNAAEGVIYFSMGTLLNTTDLPISKRNMLIEVFGKLKQTVLWRWDNDTLPEKPNNVEIRKWLPQMDILSHPNLKLFITHGGLLGTIEAVYHGVPMLAIPVFADQFTNAAFAEQEGYGLTLPYISPEFTESKLEYLITELLQNPKYKKNALERSRLFHNRPMSPKLSLKYWVEYVIQTNGAHHLKVSGINMPWYQYYLIDVAMLLTAFLVSSLVVVRLLYVSVSTRKNEKVKQT